jgi:spermidine/putrescine transport system permease protein
VTNKAIGQPIASRLPAALPRVSVAPPSNRFWRAARMGLGVVVPGATYFFLWAPIFVLVIFSFNSTRSLSVWQGFSTQWYENLFNGAMNSIDGHFTSQLMLQALRNSLIVGVSATVIATAIGTMLAMALARSNIRGKRFIDGMLLLPVVIPEITQAISLAMFFRVVFDYWQHLSGHTASLGFGSIIIGHVAFNVSYVTFIVRSSLHGMGRRYEESAYDLGANPWQTFWRVTFPLIFPGILGGAMLAFSISLDDLVMTYFMSGVGTSTLPMFVYSMLKVSVSPEVNALSTLMLLASTVLIGISLLLQGRNSQLDW